jgi:hypothetical protein
MAIKKDELNELLAGADGKDVFGKNGLFDELKKAFQWVAAVLNGGQSWTPIHTSTPSAKPARPI